MTRKQPSGTFQTMRRSNDDKRNSTIDAAIMIISLHKCYVPTALIHCQAADPGPPFLKSWVVLDDVRRVTKRWIGVVCFQP